MSGFIEIQHDEWVAATPDVVRAHYTDLNHRQIARVHPHERLRQLPPTRGAALRAPRRTGRCTQREAWERQDRPDGSVLDPACVAGAHWGCAIVARFYRSNDGSRTGTLIELTLTQPLRPVLAPSSAARFRRRLQAALREFAAEIKADVERTAALCAGCASA